MRKITEQFVKGGCTVNLCAIDLTKAFDKMDHHALFLKLMKRLIPSNLLDTLVYWFDNCWTCIKWDFITSNFYKLQYGIRQGSVLSPHLFAVYIDDLAENLPFSQKISLVMYADDILLIAPSVSELQKLLHFFEPELRWLGMSINAKKSCCLRIGPRYDVVCANIQTSDGKVLPWVKELRYLGVYIVQSRNFKCSLDEHKKGFYRAVNAIFGKVGRIASEEVTLQLIYSKCLPVLLYGLEACPLGLSESRSLDFTFNRLMMKLFKTSNIDIVNDCMLFFEISLPSLVISNRRNKFLAKYCSVANSLCSYCCVDSY